MLLPRHHFYQHLYPQRQHLRNILNCPLTTLGISMITPSATPKSQPPRTALHFLQEEMSKPLTIMFEDIIKQVMWIYHLLVPPFLVLRLHGNHHFGWFFFCFIYILIIHIICLHSQCSDINFLLCLAFLNQNTLIRF